MITCEDIEGGCCTSCHDDDEEFGFPLLEIDNDKDELAARVCCRKYDRAHWVVEAADRLNAAHKP